MREFILEIDKKIFSVINVDLAHPYLDAFFPFWTDIQKTTFFYYGVLPIIILFIFYKKNWNMLLNILYALLATFMASSINRYVLKPFFNRTRPVAEVLRVEAERSLSFPSGHTVSAFCLAALMSLMYPKARWIFILMATLTAISRIYSGVHFPSDTLAGALVGSLFGFLFFKLYKYLSRKTMHFTKLPLALLLTLLSFKSAMAYEDPTKGKPFFPWAYEDQIKPTLKKSIDGTGVTILGTGVGSSIIMRQYDKNIYKYNSENGNLLMSHDTALQFGKLGNGLIGVGIAATQIAFDTQNGVNHLQTIILTSTSHITSAYLIRRNRPDNRSDFLPFPSSYPSGHTSSAFATAGSLAYSYGWKAGIPAYIVASGIGLSRIKEDRHWASDILGGAFLGTFWARASYRAADEKKKEDAALFVPAPIFDGMMMTMIKKF